MVALVEPAGHECPAWHGPLQFLLVSVAVLPHLPGGHCKQPMDISLKAPGGHNAGFKPVRAALPATFRDLHRDQTTPTR